VRSEVSGLPDDAAARLCWAAARAGRLEAAAAATGQGEAGLESCRAAARQLLEKVRPPAHDDLVRLLGAERAGAADRASSEPEASERRIARLARDLAEEERGAAFTLLGHYLAGRGERFRGLQYLLAAQAEGGAGGSYPLRPLVARQLAACRQYARALNELDRPP
jgi:hypothetical protein